MEQQTNNNLQAIKQYSMKPEVQQQLQELREKEAAKQQVQWEKENGVILSKVVRNNETVVEDLEVIEHPIYWRALHVDKDGGMIIKIYGAEEQMRISKIIEDSKVRNLRQKKGVPSLKAAIEKAALIDALIKDNKRTKVRPGASLLFGNNVEVIPERSSKLEKEVTKNEKVRHHVAAQKIERREA